MDDILAKKNRHLFLEEKDNQNNSFIRNINYAVENIDTIKTFNENVNSGTMQHLLETYIEQVGTEGNAWVVKLTELGENILATTSGFNYASVLTVNQDIEAGATITLPEAMKYRVGTHMLLISWNGTVCYNGEQYEEVGSFNERSAVIKIKQDIKTGDKLEFRTVALADTASVTLALGDAIDNYSIVTNSTNTGRTIIERFSDIINVKDFGAKGDGVTDDTQSIALAISVAANKTLFFPDGKYIVSCLLQNSLCFSCFNIEDSINIVGENAEIECDFAHETTSSDLQNIIFLIKSSNVHFTGIKFIDKSSYLAFHTAIGCGAKYDSETDWSTTRYKNITIDNCELDGFAYGFSFKFPTRNTYSATGGVSNIRISNCYASRKSTPSTRNGAPYHFACQNIATEPISDVSVSNCVGIGYKNAATFGLYGVARGIVVNCRSENNTQVGFQCENGAKGCVLSNNISIDDNTGVIVDDSESIVIDGFHFESKTEHTSDDPTHFFNGRIRPAVWISAQGDSVELENQDRDLVGIEVSNITAINGIVTVESAFTPPANPNRILNVHFNNVCVKCTDNSYSGRKDGFFVAQQYCNAYFSNVTAIGFSRTGILFSSVAFASIKNPLLIENTASITYGGNSYIFVSGGYMDVAPSGIMISIDNCRIYGAPQITKHAGRYEGYLQQTTIDNFVAKRGSFVSLDNGYAGMAFLKAEGDNTSDGWRQVITQNTNLNFLPKVANAQNLGSASQTWANVYQGTPSSSSSDERIKDNIKDLDENILKAWGDVRFKVFQFKDAIEKKGQDARLHVGLIAQKVKTALEAYGIDGFKYGLLCYDKWEDKFEDVTVVEKEAVFDDEGALVSPEVTKTSKIKTIHGGDLYSIRYEEALALECAYQRWLGEQRDAKIEALMQRISALENNH